MRSDWDWNVEWYGAATHNTKVSCCWLCSAKPDTWKTLNSQEIKDMSLTKAAWFETLAQRDKKTNPLFHLPGVTNWTLFPDCMHVCDEGCAALAAGQILWEILPQYPASNKEERAKLLWEHIQQIYKDSKWPGDKRWPKLSVKDFKKDGKAHELDVKAAQCRHFIPLLETLTRENGFHSGSKRRIAIHNVAKYCGRMYDALSFLQSWLPGKTTGVFVWLSFPSIVPFGYSGGSQLKEEFCPPLSWAHVRALMTDGHQDVQAVHYK